MEKTVTVIGAGLAGCEAAWQLAQAGIKTELYEMKPKKFSPAHKYSGFAELVCSNSLKASRVNSAAGLLKEEMRRLGSLTVPCAEQTAVPAGGALAVDRRLFSDLVTKKIKSHENITVYEEELTEIPDGNVIIATGPLTSGGLAESIGQLCGGYLSFYDAAAPIVSFESINMNRAFFAARYGRGDDDYINCPFTKEEYTEFYNAIVNAESAPLHDFDRPQDIHNSGKMPPASKASDSIYCSVEVQSPTEHRLAAPTLAALNDGASPLLNKNDSFTVYEGCMPIEVLAKRGEETMRYGAMKPVGLTDPITGKRPYAVVQLRKENSAGTMYNIVGFQTNLKFGEQKRVFSLIPGLENAEFLRYGVMHRNSFLNSPKLLCRDFSLRSDGRIFFAGQITGVEGYMESAASGIIAGKNMVRRLNGEAPLELPDVTMLGALSAYISDESVESFQPMGANMGILPDIGERIKDKQERYQVIADRSLAALEKCL